MMISKNISKKVLVIGPHYENHKGGIGAVIALHKNEFETFNFIPTYNYHTNNISKSFYFLRQFIKLIVILKREKDIKVIHMHTSQSGSFFRKLLILGSVKFLYNKKTINHTNASHFHDFYFNSNYFIKKIISWYLHTCDVTITVSDSWKSYYEKTFQLSSVYKINNLAAKVDSCNIKEAEKLSYIKMLFLGRIGERKGIFDLLDVLIKHKDSFTGKLKLIIGGDGELDKLRQLILSNELENIVEYKGWVSGKQKDKLLREADVFILPSYNEGMPLSILEAMSFGKAIISTNVAGIPEIVFDNKNGFLIEPGDHDAIYLSIKRYLNNTELIHQHGTQSLKIIKEFYPESVIPKLENIYRKLLN